MKKLTILLLFISFISSGQDYRTIDWKTNIVNVQLLGVDTFKFEADPVDFNDKGAASRDIGNYFIDFVARTFEIIASDATTITVVDLAGENTAPQSGQIGRVYQSIVSGDSLFQSIGGVDVSVIDDLSRWKDVARNNELFGQAIDSLNRVKLQNPVDSITFDTLAPIPVTPYTMHANKEEGTIDVVLENGVTGQLFEESFISGQNDTGGTISNGKVATYQGSIGNSGNMRIELTVASATEPSFLTIGIVTQDIENGEAGKITITGKVRDIPTDGLEYGETWVDQDILYKSSTHAGGLTNVAPNAPIPAIPIAIVISAHATNGTLLVRPTYPYSITELTDVNGTPLTESGQIMVWNDAEQYFDFNFNINDYSSIPADSVTIATGIGSPTVDQLQLYIDNIGSSGFFLGGELSDGGLGTLDVAAGSGFIRTTNDNNAELQSFKWSASSGIAVTDNTTQYVYVDDSGVISLSTDEFLEAPDKIIIGVVTDESGAIESTFSLGVRLDESIGQAGRFLRRVHSVTRDKRKGGLLFGQSGDANRDVTVSSGVIWWGRTEYPISSFNTSGTDVFTTYSAGGQESAIASQWPNEQYDNSGTLTTMTNNRWANLFFYIEPDDHMVMVYGRDQFVTEALADEEGVPSASLPSRISETALLAARFTFQKGASIATISSAFEQLFANESITDHANLSSLDYASSGHTGFAPALGVDDNYVTDAEKVVVGNTSGTNTGDQTIPTISDIAYDATSWDANTDGASKNAIRDKIESMPGGHDAVTLNATATTGGLSLSTQEIGFRAATNVQTGYATSAHVTAIEANTAKATNVPTSLSVGTVGVNTVAITSDGGADDVTLPAAIVSAAGMLTTAKWAEIVTNNAKITNVSTDLSQTVAPTTLTVNSSDGDNISLNVAGVTNAGIITTGTYDNIVLNNAKVTMAYPASGIALSTGSAWGTSITNNSTNWNTAFTDRLKWDGGATGLVAATGRTSLNVDIAGTDNSDNNAANTTYASDYRAANFIAGTNYEAPITAGTTAQYWRGDKSWQTLPANTNYYLNGITHNATDVSFLVSGTTTRTLNAATGSLAGVVNNTTQTFGGNKTFSGSVTAGGGMHLTGYTGVGNSIGMVGNDLFFETGLLNRNLYFRPNGVGSNTGLVSFSTTSAAFTQKVTVDVSNSGDYGTIITNSHSTNGYGLKVSAGDDANVFPLVIENYLGTDLFLVNGVGDGTFSGSVTADDYTATTGATINEFSTDGTLAGNSDTAAPTERAVKTYADRPYTVQSLSGTSVTMNSNSGWRGSLTLTGATTLTITNLPDGAEGSIEITNGATAYTLNINGSTGYTTEVVMSENSTINSTTSSHTTVSYWRTGSTLYYGFIYDN